MTTIGGGGGAAGAHSSDWTTGDAAHVDVEVGEADATPAPAAEAVRLPDRSAREAARADGRAVTTFEGVRLRSDAWAVEKRALATTTEAYLTSRVDRVRSFGRRIIDRFRP